VLFAFESALKIRTHAVKGTFTAKEALKRMIEDTPLTFTFINERTVTLTVNASAPAPPSRNVAQVPLTAN
jgi:hypothetical protein